MYRRILVPTDGSAGSRAALAEAVELADRFDATVHSLYVADTSAAHAETGYIDIVESFERIGEETTAEAVDYADEAGADLVVMGTHGRTGLDRYLLGSVTEKVVRTADVPVLTVRAPDDEEGAESGADADPAEEN